MRNDDRNLKLYGQDLKAQMQEMEQRKSQEKQVAKEKIQISGIFGGEHGRDRIHQIQYIDKKMGLSPKIDRSMEM